MPPIQCLFRSFTVSALFVVCVAHFVSREQIRQSSAQCCPHKFRECCEQRMQRDERIHCADGLSEQRALAMAICLEKQLHGGQSVIERRGHKCCWLLSGGEKCQRRCYAQLRAPTIPPTQKFTFTDDCPSLPLNGTVPISELNCVTDREAVVHSCFPVCLHWWENNQSAWTSEQRDGGRTFDPLQDCPALVALINSEHCLIPVDFFKMAQTNEVNNNGTLTGGKQKSD